MTKRVRVRTIRPCACALFSFVFVGTAFAQLTDVTQAPNAANAGIKKSLTEQVGTGRGDAMTPGSSTFIIRRDPFRSIVRGRQIFQRKFTAAQGLGPRTGDGVGAIEADGSIGAGLADSCAACHGRPFGSAGFGGKVFTRPESRDAPHLFGLGLVEMLADEITADLRAIQDEAVTDAMAGGSAVTRDLVSKGLSYGRITAAPDGSVDVSEIEGIDADLRVKPFFAEGSQHSIRQFSVGAFNAEMGLEAPDPDLLAASQGLDVSTPSGMILAGTRDAFDAPVSAHTGDDPDGDGVMDEVPTAIVDHLEFYLLNYFKPGSGESTNSTRQGRQLFDSIGCASCHVPDLTIETDRRVADVETVFDSNDSNAVLNFLFATATPLHGETDDGSGFPTLKPANGGSFVVKNIFADFKRHDLGPNFHERNFDGSLQTEFMTEPLWGVGDTAPYGHDGRSGSLRDVILRHGGEAEQERNAFNDLSRPNQEKLIAFLNTLVLFSPPDTASNLDPADRNDPDFPMVAHGSIDLSPLFENPADKE